VFRRNDRDVSFVRDKQVPPGSNTSAGELVFRVDCVGEIAALLRILDAFACAGIDPRDISAERRGGETGYAVEIICRDPGKKKARQLAARIGEHWLVLDVCLSGATKQSNTLCGPGE
jgi:hypothetical protein